MKRTAPRPLELTPEPRRAHVVLRMRPGHPPVVLGAGIFSTGPESLTSGCGFVYAEVHFTSGPSAEEAHQRAIKDLFTFASCAGDVGAYWQWILNECLRAVGSDSPAPER